MELFNNIDLLAVGIAVAATGILGFIVFSDNRKSATNQAFFFFSLITILYGIVNYTSYKVSLQPAITLLLLRLTIFLAVWHAFSFFQLFWVFPAIQVRFPKYYSLGLVPFAAVAAISTLTPFVFSGIESFNSAGGVSRAAIGPAIPLFGITVTGFILGGVFLLIRKMVSAQDNVKRQLKFISFGALITFSLLIIFNLILPVVFEEVRYIPFAPVFILPFIIATAYAIFKHGLLNARVIAADILTFLLVSFTFFEILISKTASEIIFRSGLFGFLLIFGILLIRSVRKEVEQREQLQILSQELSGANAELKKLDEAKSEFISIASHQLRSPLTVIRGYIAMFREGTFGPITEQAREALGKVSFSAEQLIKLVASLLNLSRIESGKIKYDFTKNDFIKLVKGIVEEFIPYARDKGVELSFENKSDDLMEMVFDSDKMREVLVNLIDNAIKYSPNGKVTVTLSKNASILLSVKDSGIGIAREDLRKLFAKFSRSTDAQKVDPNGMGIGLYFVKRVVEDHGGKVWADSEGVGKGSSFVVELPIRY